MPINILQLSNRSTTLRKVNMEHSSKKVLDAVKIHKNNSLELCLDNMDKWLTDKNTYILITSPFLSENIGHCFTEEWQHIIAFLYALFNNDGNSTSSSIWSDALRHRARLHILKRQSRTQPDANNPLFVLLPISGAADAQWCRAAVKATAPLISPHIHVLDQIDVWYAFCPSELRNYLVRPAWRPVGQQTCVSDNRLLWTVSARLNRTNQAINRLDHVLKVKMWHWRNSKRDPDPLIFKAAQM